jgi:hypothetical protein
MQVSTQSRDDHGGRFDVRFDKSFRLTFPKRSRAALAVFVFVLLGRVRQIEVVKLLSGYGIRRLFSHSFSVHFLQGGSTPKVQHRRLIFTSKASPPCLIGLGDLHIKYHP